jgi:cytoplasmic FMR1 interacting protein
MAYQGLAGLYRDFFGIPHMFAVVKLLGSRSLPGIIRALLDHISSKVSDITFHYMRYHAPEGALS